MPYKNPDKERAYQRKYARSRRAKRRANPLPPEQLDALGHGKRATYDAGCACTPCRDAMRAYFNSLPARKPRNTAAEAAAARARYRREQGEVWYRDGKPVPELLPPRRCRPWTADELRVAIDASMTSAEAAAALGRTYAGVKDIRARVARADPNVAHLLAALHADTHPGE